MYHNRRDNAYHWREDIIIMGQWAMKWRDVRHEEDEKGWVHLGPYKDGGQDLCWEQVTEGF